MRPCPNCGELVDEHANFCHMCGQRMPPEAPPPPPEPIQLPVLDDEPRLQRRVGWGLALVAVAALVAVGSVFALNSADEDTDASPADPAGATNVSSAPDPQALLGATGTVRIQVSIGRCEGCLVTAIPADGTVEQSASVVNGSVEFAMDKRSTLGLGFTVSHPQGYGEAGGPNVAVLAPLGTPPGTRVGAAKIADSTSVGICWAGTLGTTASIPLAIEPHGDRTPAGGLRVWADPAQPVLESRVAPSGDGTVEAPALTTCGNEFRLLGG